MFNISLYCLLLLVLFIYSIAKKVNPISILLIGVYLGISLFSFAGGLLGYVHVEKTTLAPFLFLILCYIIYMYPFLNSRDTFSSQKVIYTIDDKYRWVVVFYVICAIIYLIAFIPQVTRLFSEGNWFRNYNNQIFGEEGAVFIYRNVIEWFAAQVAGRLSYLAIIVSFVFLKERRFMRLSLVSITLYIVQGICAAAYVSSRSMLFQTVIIIVALYLFVFPDIKKSTKRLFILIGVASAFVIVPYIIAVTVSRFSSLGAGRSLISYMGQAPVVFNYGVAPIDKLSWGKYSVSYLFGKDFTIDQYAVGGSWGSGFYTFVGWLYIDWGPIGVILIGVVLAYFINKLIKKTQYNISDLLLIMYYYYILINGAFVIGPQQILSIVITMILYLFIKVFIEKYKYKVGNKVY